MSGKLRRKPDTTNQARLILLVNLIRQLQPVSLKELMERLEVSRATLRRDFDVLRDRLNMPLTYDRWSGGYSISEPPDRYGRSEIFELPGLWLNADEGYALLTLFNVLQRIDPGLLGVYVSPLRGVIKRALGNKKFDMMGLNFKIGIELEEFRSVRQPIFNKLSHALMNDKKIELQFSEEIEINPGIFWLSRMVLTPSGWDVEAAEVNSHKKIRAPALSIIDAKFN